MKAMSGDTSSYVAIRKTWDGSSFPDSGLDSAVEEFGRSLGSGVVLESDHSHVCNSL